MNRRQFILTSKTKLSRLTTEDRRDARKAQRVLAQFRSGNLRTVSHEALKRELKF